MKQVLLNLTLNALDAVPADGGEVRIEGGFAQVGEGSADVHPPATHGSLRSAHALDRWVEIAVIDNGRGMTQEVLERIFEPFYTDKRGATEPGTGLGLSITHAIVERHGGYIRAESPGPGRGSRFTIRFPWIDAPVSRARRNSVAARRGLGFPLSACAGRPPPLASPWTRRGLPWRPTPHRRRSHHWPLKKRLRPMTPAPSAFRDVLLVEDETRMREMLTHAAEGMGMNVRAVSSGEQARRHLKQNPCDILLLDLNLPGMGGMELLEVLREEHPDVQVIVLTGFGDLMSAKRAIRLDVVDFLTKPCPLDELEVAFHRARLRRLQRSQAAEPSRPQPSVDRSADRSARAARVEAIARIAGDEAANRRTAATRARVEPLPAAMPPSTAAATKAAGPVLPSASADDVCGEQPVANPPDAASAVKEAPTAAGVGAGESVFPGNLAEMERRHIFAVLERNNGNRVAAAAELGICLRTLYYRLGRYQQGKTVETKV